MNKVLHVNGKFLAQRTTGTQRYATEVVRALAVEPTVEMLLHVPANARVPAGLAVSLRVRRSRLNGIAFEQLALPLASRSNMLLNLAGPAPLLKRKQLVVIHDVTPFRRPESYSRLFRLWYFIMYTVVTRRAEHIASVSEFSIQEIRTIFRIPAERIVELLPCGWQHFPQRAEVAPPAADRAGYALMVGTNVAHKNIGPAVNALVARGIPVKLVGGTGAGNVFTSRRFGRVSEGSVEVLGYVSDEKLAELYRSATAFVFPSTYEGFGIPVLEAQYFRCPLICSNRGALPEVAGDGAIFFDTDDLAASADAFWEIHADNALRALLIAKGSANLQRFSWAGTALRLRMIVTQ